jgi:predicted membrane-bound dolichyl-phosphate-mannose-protein mannosyltransferase
MILLVSAFTHLWNVAGFPDIFFDEGVYMRRAMHVLAGFGPQEAFFHDHPFFGQLFLATILADIGYPQSLNPVPDSNSVYMLYMIPRIIMGLLAIFDTFLVYKIASKRYGNNVAIVASLLFAVMPITWITRRILLDTILLPFLLGSILAAVHFKDSKNKNLLVIISGVLLGLAIFTKIPAAAMIPLVVTLIYQRGDNNKKFMILLLIPIILLPLIWPIQSILSGQFDLWIRDVLGQTQRHSGGLPLISGIFLISDPVLFILGIAGIIFAGIRRNFFILVWFLPFVAFLGFIGYTQYFHWIPILPVFCIAAAVLLVEKLKNISKGKIRKILFIFVISGIGIFGVVSTSMLITTNVTASQFEAVAFTLKQTQDNNTTILAGPQYSWIFQYVFEKKHVYLDYSDLLFYPVQTKKTLLIADPHFMIDIGRGKQLQDIYNSTNKIATFDGNVLNYDLSKYPYTSMAQNYEASHIEIRAK